MVLALLHRDADMEVKEDRARRSFEVPAESRLLVEDADVLRD